MTAGLARILHRLRSSLPGRRATGPRGEALAAKFLRKQNYKILARNLRNRFGEVDLLAQAPDHRTIVLVEVKTSVAPDAAHRPETRVNLKKQRKLAALAAQIARTRRLTDRPFRFDVIAIELPPHAPPTIRHFPGAFDSPV